MSKISPKSFYVMRHGSTTDNEKGVISGSRSDPDLSDDGRKKTIQARETYNLLEKKPDRVIVSGLKRTHQTAEIVAGHNNFIVEPGLNERDLGEFDGKITEAEQKTLGKLPGEQTSEDHSKKVVAALSKQLNNGDGIPLVVVHGGTTRRILEAVGFEKGVKVDNAQIYHFVPIHDRWKIFELSVADGKLQRKDITPQNLTSGFAQGAAG